MIEHEQYYRKGGTYELPIEIYNDLIGQIEEAQKERDEYKQLYENGLKVNQNTEKYRTELETKYVILQQENERLKEKLENKLTPEELVNMLNQELVRQNKCYKSRCEKAMELINKNSNYPTYYLTGNIVKELKNILIGSDEK